MVSSAISQINPTTLQLTLIGIIDESYKLPVDDDFSDYRQLKIDFAQVSFINSGGIKNWINFLETLIRFDELQISFENCNKMIVDQINRTVGFLPESAQVCSVFIPFFCPKCEQSQDIHVRTDITEIDKTSLIGSLGKIVCEKNPDCKKPLEIDVHPDEFFKFLIR